MTKMANTGEDEPVDGEAVNGKGDSTSHSFSTTGGEVPAQVAQAYRAIQAATGSVGGNG